MASPSGLPTIPAAIPPPPAPFPGGTTPLQTLDTAPTPALLTTTIYTNSVLDFGPISSGTLSASHSLSNGAPSNPPWKEGSDNLTASPVYLFIFAIALGALIILSLTIVIRSLVLRQRLVALHGPDWRRQYGWTILEMLGLSSRRMWPDPGTQPGPQPGRTRRRDHGRKPVLVDVYVGEGKDIENWKDTQPYSTALRHPDTINPSVKPNTISLLSLRAKEFQPAPRRASNRTRSSTRAAREQHPPTPTRPPLSPLSPLSPLRRLPFCGTAPPPPPPPTSFKPPPDEKYTAPCPSRRHSRSSSSASSVRDLKSAEQPLAGLAVDVCLLVRMPTAEAPAYRRPHFAPGPGPARMSVSVSVRQTPLSRGDSASSLGLGETEAALRGELVIACAQGVQLWGIPERPPPREIPVDVDSRRGNGQ